MLSKMDHVPQNVLKNIEYIMNLKAKLNKEIASEID